MPQYRKLYTKIVESFDVQDMPDDFTRLMWILLPLKSCREGRGINHHAWLKSNLFPLRSDVTPEQIQSAMSWYKSNGMIITYEVDKRPYYQIVNWSKYQGNTSKEAKSLYPDKSKSGVSPELVQSKSVTDADAVFNIQYSDADVDAATATTAAVYTSYENNIGSLTPIIADKIGDAIDTYPHQWIIDAIGEAVNANVRKWNYITAILKRWQSDGRTSIGDNGQHDFIGAALDEIEDW